MRGKRLLRIGISTAVVTAILVHVPGRALQGAFRGVSLAWLLAALFCVAGMLAARYYRWRRLLAAGGFAMSRRDAGRSLLGGFTLSLITPGRAGELGRCLFVEEAARAPVLMLNVLDRALDTWALLTCAVLSLMALNPRPHGIFALGVWLALLPAAMGLPAFVSHVGGIPWWPAALREKLHAASRRMMDVRVPAFSAWALISTGLDLLTFYCLLRALQPVSLVAVLMTFPLMIIVGGLPISISGLGPREGVAAVLLARYAVPSAVAIDATLLFWVFSAVLPAVAGGAWSLVSGVPLPRFAFEENYPGAAEKQSA